MGRARYTPANDYTGPDSFTWKANDGFEDSNTATFSITVAANSPPEASDQTRTTVEGLPVAIVLEAIDGRRTDIHDRHSPRPRDTDRDGASPHIYAGRGLHRTGQLHLAGERRSG